ncbi:MAG TPA: hypothetical protein VIV65_06085, partial [Gemmatimonadaceae bacterium]
MRSRLMILACGLLGAAQMATAQDSTRDTTPAARRLAAERRAYLDSLPTNTVRLLVKRLELERYKATLVGLSQFGDRRQGTERNRKAVDWIEAQLKSYGCPTERVIYQYTGRQLRNDSTDHFDSLAGHPRPPRAGRGGAAGGRGGAGGAG